MAKRSDEELQKDYNRLTARSARYKNEIRELRLILTAIVLTEGKPIKVSGISFATARNFELLVDKIQDQDLVRLSLKAR